MGWKNFGEYKAYREKKEWRQQSFFKSLWTIIYHRFFWKPPKKKTITADANRFRVLYSNSYIPLTAKQRTGYKEYEHCLIRNMAYQVAEKIIEEDLFTLKEAQCSDGVGNKLMLRVIILKPEDEQKDKN